MGMNIYKLKKDGGEHIGKRWANGVWCWDCKVKAERDNMACFWFCPKCSQRCSDRTLAFNPAFRELGFDKNKEVKHTGVDGASGFVWHAKNKKDALKKIANIEKFRTEYGEYWSKRRFLRMFNDVIEESFSDYDFS